MEKKKKMTAPTTSNTAIKKEINHLSSQIQILDDKVCKSSKLIESHIDRESLMEKDIDTLKLQSTEISKGLDSITNRVEVMEKSIPDRFDKLESAVHDIYNKQHAMEPQVNKIFEVTQSIEGFSKVVGWIFDNAKPIIISLLLLAYVISGKSAMELIRMLLA